MVGSPFRRRKSNLAMRRIAISHMRDHPSRPPRGRARHLHWRFMRYQRLDLNLLTALRVLLAERNVTRAGETLHVSQPAMSGMLARLREYFDDPLIVPVGRKMELTPLAETLVDKVNDLMLRVDATLSTRPEFDPAASHRRFSIVASDYLIQVLMLGVLREIHHEAPGVTIEFRQPSNTAAIDLENGEVDFVINPARFSTPNQASTVLFEDTYHAVVARDNADVGDSLTLAQFKALHHVTLENNGKPLFETWFVSEHGAPEHLDVVVNSFGLLPQLLAGTRRVATLHTRMALQSARQWPVRLVGLAFEVPRLVETMQWHRYRDLDPGSQWLREKIIAHAKALPAPEQLVG